MAVEIETDSIGHATIILALIIIFVSVIFNWIRRLAYERAPKLYMPVFHSLFEELTALGFVSLLIFVLGANVLGTESVLEALSKLFLGGPDVLKELAEGTHMLIFLFMITLIFFVVGALIYVKRLSKKWESFEKASPKSSAKAEAYHLVRSRFIATCELIDGTQFDFFEYRKTVAAQEYCQVVHLHPTDWLIAAIILYAVWTVADAAGLLGGAVVLGFTFSVLVFLLVLRHRLSAIRNVLWPRAAGVTTYGTASPTEPPYLLNAPPEPRNAFMTFLLGPVGDRHRALFPLGARGPNLIRRTLRVSFLTTALVIVVLAAGYANQKKTSATLLVLSAVLPAVAVVAVVIASVKLLADVTSVEMLKDHTAVRKVVRRQRTLRSLTSLRALAALDAVAMSRTPQQQRLASGGESQLATSVREMFHSLDVDGSGLLDHAQFSELVLHMGLASEADVDTSFATIDTAGTGKVSFTQVVPVAMWGRLTGRQGRRVRPLCARLPPDHSRARPTCLALSGTARYLTVSSRSIEPWQIAVVVTLACFSRLSPAQTQTCPWSQYEKRSRPSTSTKPVSSRRRRSSGTSTTTYMNKNLFGHFGPAYCP